MIEELKTRFWIDALRWRAEGAGASVYFSRRGDPDAGVVLVRVDDLAGRVRLFAPMRDFSGERMWTEPLGAAASDPERLTRYVERRADNDPDLWVVDIEDRQGRSFLTEPVEES